MRVPDSRWRTHNADGVEQRSALLPSRAERGWLSSRDGQCNNNDDNDDDDDDDDDVDDDNNNNDNGILIKREPVVYTRARCNVQKKRKEKKEEKG